MAHQQLRFQLQSESPLILHNGQTADPLNKYAKMLKQVTGKRAKTDADYEELARIEWYASLYLDDNSKICLPSHGLEAAFASGAKKLKLGQSAQAGLFVNDHAPLRFDGDDLTVDELWKRDQNRLTCGVRVQRNKVMRTRALFKKWSADAVIVFDDGLLNQSQVVDIVRITGEVCGIFDWRPKFGRYSSKLV